MVMPAGFGDGGFTPGLPGDGADDVGKLRQWWLGMLQQKQGQQGAAKGGPSIGPEQGALTQGGMLPPVPGGLQLPMNDGSGGSRTIVPNYDRKTGQPVMQEIIRPNRAPAPAGDYGALGQMADPRAYLQQQANAKLADPPPPVGMMGPPTPVGLGNPPQPQSWLQGGDAQKVMADIMGANMPRTQQQIDAQQQRDLEQGKNMTALATTWMQANAARGASFANFMGALLNKDMDSNQRTATINAYLSGEDAHKPGLASVLGPFAALFPGAGQGGGPGAQPPDKVKSREEIEKAAAADEAQKKEKDRQAQEELARQTGIGELMGEVLQKNQAGKVTGIDTRLLIDRMAARGMGGNPKSIADIAQRLRTAGALPNVAMQKALALELAKSARNSGLDLSEPQQVGGLTLHQTDRPSDSWWSNHRNMSIAGPQGKWDIGYTRDPVGLMSVPGWLGGQDDVFPTTNPATMQANKERSALIAALLGAYGIRPE